MNKDLLFALYGIHSPSGNEKKMRKYLKKRAYERGATKVEQDKLGNLFITKGESDTYPCLAAHIDQVQKNHSKDFTVFEKDDIVFGWSSKSMAQQGLGADDKNGIFICLECLEKYDILKVAFFVGEEVGCVGSSDCDLDFFKDCRFIIEPDRMNGTDLITSMFCGEVCSEDFIAAIGHQTYGYIEEVGSITDVGELVERGVGISCLNLSCGYYNAHTDHEVTNLTELANCLDFVQHIVETCTDVYPFEYNPYSYGGYNKGYGGYFGGYKTKNKEEEYFDGGYYDEDFSTMQTLLELDPNFTFYEIFKDYRLDFHASELFSNWDAWDVLECVYNDAKYVLGRECVSEQDEELPFKEPADTTADDMNFDDIHLDAPKLEGKLKKVS